MPADIVGALQDTYKTETASALHTLKSDYDTAASTCNQLTQQIDKQQADHSAELAALHETHAAGQKEQQLQAEGLRQQLQAEQARAATAEERLATSTAAAVEHAATVTKLQADITGECSAAGNVCQYSAAQDVGHVSSRMHSWCAARTDYVSTFHAWRTTGCRSCC